MSKKVITMVCLALTLVCMFAVGVSADTVTASEATSQLNGFIDTVMEPINNVLTLENLGIILVAALGITVVFFVVWFGYRFITRKASSAVKKGKLG